MNSDESTKGFGDRLPLLQDRVWKCLESESKIDLRALSQEFPEFATRLDAIIEEVRDAYSELQDVLLEVIRKKEKNERIDLEALLSSHPRIADRLRIAVRTINDLKDAVGPPEHFELRNSSKYQIGREMIFGGMGAVVRAVDVEFGREAALKVPLKRVVKNQELLARHDREAALNGMLQHPNILPVFEKGELESIDGEKVPYFAIPYLTGPSLADRLNERRDPNEQQFEFVLIYRQICQAMSYAHSLNVIHRDLKPQNVMLGTYGDAYVIDWGYGKLLDDSPCSQVLRREPMEDLRELMFDRFQSEVTQLFQVSANDWQTNVNVTKGLGTPSYLPPEIVHQNEFTDKRLDVFCLGGILCHILTGAATFRGGDYEIRRQILEKDLTDAFHRLELCTASRDLVDIARQCLDPDPAKRPADASQVAQRITRFIEDTEQAKIRAEQRKVLAEQEKLVAEQAKVAAEKARTLEEQAKTAAERKLRKLSISTISVTSAVIVGALIWLWHSSHVNRLRDIDRAASQAYSKGDLEEAAKQYELLSDLGDESVTTKVRSIRARISRIERSKLIEECEGLRKKIGLIAGERAQVEFVLGDLLSCDNARTAEGREILEGLVESKYLANADREYIRALTAADLASSLRHLGLCLASERFHHRGMLLQAALQFSAGRLSEATHSAELAKLVYPAESVLDDILESARFLKAGGNPPRVSDEVYMRSLVNLASSYSVPIVDSPQPGLGQLTFRRQVKVVQCLKEVILNLPKADSMPGLPILPFVKRFETWTQFEKLAEKSAPPLENTVAGFLELVMQEVGLQKIDRRQITSELESLAKNETDSLALQLATMSKFVLTAEQYATTPSDKTVVALAEMEGNLSKSLLMETLAPQSQFRIAARVLRVISAVGHKQMATPTENYSIESMPTVRDDIYKIYDSEANYPELQKDVGNILMNLILRTGGSTKLSNVTRDEISLALEIANRWLAIEPGSATALVWRALVWEYIGNEQMAREDVLMAEKTDPKNGLVKLTIQRLAPK